MADDSVVEQIVKSLSFEVEAVPQEKDVQAASTSNMTPLNIKIRVRKKDKSDIERGLLSVPKFGNPTSAPERIRLISSDQTIMSFNVLMEADLVKKAKRKPRKYFFGGCLGTQYDDDDGPYVPSSTYSAKVTDTSISSKSEGVLKQNFTLLKNQNDNTNDLDLPFNKKTGILGKCKRGGCLDPPFGEDNYTYKPVLKDDHLVTSISENKVQRKAQTEKHDDKKQDNIMILKSSKNNVSKKKTKEGVHDDSILSIFEADRLKDSLDTKYSDSIITYPPEASSSTNFNEKKYLRNRISSEETQRKSMNEGSESFFSPSKKGNRRKESKEHKKIYASSTDAHMEKPEAGLVSLRQNENVDGNLERVEKACPPQYVAAATLISLGAATKAVAKPTNIDKDAISLSSKTDLKSKLKEPIDSDHILLEKPRLGENKSDDIKSPQFISYKNTESQEKNDMKRLPLKLATDCVNSDAGSFGNIDPGKKSYNNNPPDMTIDDQSQKYKKSNRNPDIERQPLRHAFIDDTSDAGSYGNIDPGKKSYSNNPSNVNVDGHMDETFLENPKPFIPISEQFKDGISRPFDMQKDIKDKYEDANSINSTVEKTLINQSDLKDKCSSETYNTEKTEVIYKSFIEKTKITSVPSRTVSTLSNKDDDNSIIEASRGTAVDESRTHKTEFDKISQISTDRIHNKRSDLLQKEAEEGSTIVPTLENNLKKNTDEIMSLQQQPLHISTYDNIIMNNAESSYDNQKTSDKKNYTNIDLQNNKQNPSETESTFENYEKDLEFVNIKESKENAFQSNEQKDILDKESKDLSSKKVVEGNIEGYPEPTFKVSEHMVIDDELQGALNEEFQNNNLFTNDVALLTTEKESLKINIERAKTSYQKYLNTPTDSKDSNDNIYTKSTSPSTKHLGDGSDSIGSNREDVYGSHSDALLMVVKTEKSISPNGFNSAHSASLLRTALKSLDEDRSRTTVEIATTNLTSSRSSIIKDKIKDNITLELGFQSYLNDKKERVLKTIDTSKELVHQSNETVTIIKSQIRPQLKDNIRVAIDSKNELSIQIKRTDSPVRFQIQDNDTLDHKPSHITGHTNIPNKKDKSYEAKSHGKITGVDMQRILNSMYEHDLIPLQKSINYLKQDIELLSLQQKLYNKNKANSSKRSKPIRVYKANQKCDCWKK